MANVAWLEELRSIGVKRAVFSEQAANGEAKLLEVEFFPKSPLEFADALLTGDGSDNTPTDRPPADVDGPMPGVRIPAALQNIMKNGSVS